MKRSVSLSLVLLVLLGLGVTTAFGQTSGTWVLGDWSTNVNGSTSNPPAPPSSIPNVNYSGFDFGTGLGSLVFTVNTPGPNYVGVYLNPYLDTGFGDLTNSYGSVGGTAPAGLTYQLDWPVNIASGTIWSNFAGNTLDKSNTVGAYSAPPNACCSVAIAEILGFNVGAGGQEIVTFTTSTIRPESGFYLQVTNYDTGDSYYLTETASYRTSATPEPGSMLLMASGISVLLAKGKRFFGRRNAA